MAESTARRQGELERGVFRILLEHPEGLQAKEVLRRLEELVPPTDFENSRYPKNRSQRRFEKIVRFGTIGPTKAGWLLKDKGTWSLTAEGREAFEHYSDPEQFMREARRLYRRWKDAQPSKEDHTDPADESADAEEEPEATTILEEAEESAWSEIESHLATLPPYEFQELVAALLRGMGYHVSWIAPPGPDRGIDVIAHADPLGISGPRVKVQVKRRADRVAVAEIRSFMAMLSDGDVGLFVANGGFTKDAEDEARYQERRRIMLVDSKRLFDLWVEHYGRISELKRRLLPLKPVYFLAPED
jgi:restriction system protein